MASVFFFFCLAASVASYEKTYSGLPLTIWRKPAPPVAASHFAVDNPETYGYVDRYPPVERPSPRYAFGVPHRFMDKPRAMEPSDYDLYVDNTFSPRSGSLNKRARGYEDRWAPWAYDESDSPSEYEPEYYQSEPDPQDVINFERYLQRYFDKSRADYDDTTNDEVWGSVSNEDSYPQYRNDEDAATQLHSLVTPRRPSPLNKALGLDRLKKSQTETTTTKPSTTTVPTTVQPTGAGQKEEALLRPPSPSRSTAPVTQEPAKQAESDRKTIYDTIKRLFEMHSKLEVQDEDNAQEGSRMKRFVSQEESLFRNPVALERNKIKA